VRRVPKGRLNDDANAQGCHFVFSRDAAQEWPTPVAQFRRDEGPSSLVLKTQCEYEATYDMASESAVPPGLVLLFVPTQR